MKIYLLCTFIATQAVSMAVSPPQQKDNASANKNAVVKEENQQQGMSPTSLPKLDISDYRKQLVEMEGQARVILGAIQKLTVNSLDDLQQRLDQFHKKGQQLIEWLLNRDESEARNMVRPLYTLPLYSRINLKAWQYAQEAEEKEDIFEKMLEDYDTILDKIEEAVEDLDEEAQLASRRTL